MRKVRLTALVLAVFIIGLILNMENISAFFYDTEVLSDELVFGSIETQIVEEYDTKPIVPGEEFKKVVTIKNIGKNSCFVRVRVLISPEEYTEILNLDINTSDWEYKDGYYYYKHILNINEETTPLFTKLTIPPGLENGDSFDVNIYSESIQSIAYNGKNTPINNYLEIFNKL